MLEFLIKNCPIEITDFGYNSHTTTLDYDYEYTVNKNSTNKISCIKIPETINKSSTGLDAGQMLKVDSFDPPNFILQPKFIIMISAGILTCLLIFIIGCSAFCSSQRKLKPTKCPPILPDNYSSQNTSQYLPNTRLSLDSKFQKAKNPKIVCNMHRSKSVGSFQPFRDTESDISILNLKYPNRTYV